MSCSMWIPSAIVGLFLPEDTVFQVFHVLQDNVFCLIPLYLQLRVYIIMLISFNVSTHSDFLKAKLFKAVANDGPDRNLIVGHC